MNSQPKTDQAVQSDKTATSESFNSRLSENGSHPGSIKKGKREEKVGSGTRVTMPAALKGSFGRLGHKQFELNKRKEEVRIPEKKTGKTRRKRVLIATPQVR